MSKPVFARWPLGLLVLLAAGLGFYVAAPSLTQPQGEVRGNRKASAVVASSAAPSSTPAMGEDSADGERPFWEDAVVPEPTRPRLPTAAVVPRRTGPVIPRDYAAELQQWSQAGNVTAMNETLVLWFQSNPNAVTDWLNAAPELEPLAPAMAQVAEQLAGEGQGEVALVWADSISDDGRRREARLRVFARQARHGGMTEAALKAAGLNAEEVRQVLSGALTD